MNIYRNANPDTKDLLTGDNDNVLTYKDISVLSNFVNEQGKILPRRVTGLKAKQQKQIAKLIKQARIVALLPFVIGKT